MARNGKKQETLHLCANMCRELSRMNSKTCCHSEPLTLYLDSFMAMIPKSIPGSIRVSAYIAPIDITQMYVPGDNDLWIKLSVEVAI